MSFVINLRPLHLLLPVAVVIICVAIAKTKDLGGGPGDAMFGCFVWIVALLLLLAGAVVALGFELFF